jgi:hypothetical protein
VSEHVEVPFEGQAKDRAILLLAAAEDLGKDPQAIQTRTGSFYVDPEVAEKAGLSTRKSDAEDDSEKPSEEKPAPKKRAAKKSTSKPQE